MVSEILTIFLSIERRILGTRLKYQIAIQKCVSSCRFTVWKPFENRTLITPKIAILAVLTSSIAVIIWHLLYWWWLRTVYCINNEIRILKTELEKNRIFRIYKSNVTDLLLRFLIPFTVLCVCYIKIILILSILFISRNFRILNP